MVECTYNQATQTLTCLFAGRMDGSSSEEGNRIISEKLDGIRMAEETDPGSAPPGDDLKIVFDLGGVDYVSSVFFRICIIIARKTQKGNFSIVNTNPFVSKTFKTAGLEDILNVS